MMKYMAAFAAAGLVAANAQAADDDSQTFRPSTSWAADFGDDYCRLVRTFSNGKDEVSLAFERIEPTSLVRIMVVGDSVRLYRRATTIGYNFLPAGDSRSTQLLRAKASEGKQMLILAGVNFGPDLAAFFAPPGAGGGPPPGVAAGAPPAPGTPLYNAEWEAGFLDNVSGLALTEGTLSPVRIETGPMKEAVGILRDCTYDLLSYWGVDGEKHRTISRTVVPESGITLPQGVVGFQDFGKLAGGANQIRLMIDAAGKPTDCKVHAASLSDTTNRRICDHLTRNAAFQPALDSAGQPMASYWITSVFALFGPPGGT